MEDCTDIFECGDGMLCELAQCRGLLHYNSIDHDSSVREFYCFEKNIHNSKFCYIKYC